MPLTHEQLDRAVGSVLVSAVGDALGSQYEFGPALADDVQPEFGIGYFGHAVGEWTDDTSMALPILLSIIKWRGLGDETAFAEITADWREWSKTSKDVGAQTSRVLSGIAMGADEASIRDASRTVFEQSGSEGNGSLMRTGPLALGFLAPDGADGLAAAARRVSQLTHWGDDSGDATVLWCLMIRTAILTGTLDPIAPLDWLPADRRDRWHSLIEQALAEGTVATDFTTTNGWVVSAFQSALNSVVTARDAREAIERAIRGGGDTDTVAAIAGSLAGALWGQQHLPAEWTQRVHGWPSLRAVDLVTLARTAAQNAMHDAEAAEVRSTAS